MQGVVNQLLCGGEGKATAEQPIYVLDGKLSVVSLKTDKPFGLQFGQLVTYQFFECINSCTQVVDHKIQTLASLHFALKLYGQMAHPCDKKVKKTHHRDDCLCCES